MAKKKKPESSEPLKKEDAIKLVRDRIKEFRRVPRSELMANPQNWRVHNYAQRLALQELLGKVGIAGAATAYHSQRNGGKLTLIDGHMRLEEIGNDLPTMILDVNDEEADLLLLTLDPMRQMADMDQKILGELLEQQRLETPALEDMLRGLKNDLRDRGAEIEEEEVEVIENDGPPEMALQPFEHYDYLLVIFRTIFDFQAACEKLGISKVGFTLKDGKTRKIGLGRAVDGTKFLEVLK